MFNETIFSLLPAIVAIVLALITKEVYSSLFIGIICGGLLYTGFNVGATVSHVFGNGIIASLSDSYNVGILMFLVILGTIVVLMNRAGGSEAFGKWATEHIKTREGSMLATIALGVLIFIDDYFNCLTVGSVMRPVTDKQKISRAKLAYLIDATAAPVCIIAPVSSWAAAVSGFVEGANGIQLFIRAIPYNFYAFVTIAMMLLIAKYDFDFGPMRNIEDIVKNGGDDASALTAGGNLSASPKVEEKKGRVIHLVFPIVTLIVCCICGLVVSGGILDGVNFIEAFSGADASVGLSIGSAIALIIIILFMLATKVMNYHDCLDSFPEGFKSMVPAILILTFAWSLKAMTDSLGAKVFVANFVASFADNSAIMSLLPAIVFVVGALLAFATGTSWGTFGVLIPIVVNLFSGNLSNELMIISISACMAGAVCGDHCSPISDTTIMASAGAECNHLTHVSTQLPYAIFAAFISLISFIIAGYVRNAFICLPISIVLITVSIIFMSKISNKKDQGTEKQVI